LLLAVAVVAVVVILAATIIAPIISAVIALVVTAITLSVITLVIAIIVTIVVASIIAVIIASIPVVVATIGPAVTVITSIRSMVTVVEMLVTVLVTVVVALGLLGFEGYSKATLLLLALPHGMLGVAVELALVVHDLVKITLEEGGRSWWICHVSFTRSLSRPISSMVVIFSIEVVHHRVLSVN
jgi:hypothetical protein